MNILLAEDDRAFGTILKRELEDDGYTVDLVHDGVDAVLNTIENNYGFVILDIKMPRLDGIHSLKIIKKLHPSMPAITISGNAGNGEMADSVRVGSGKRESIPSSASIPSTSTPRKKWKRCARPERRRARA